MTDAVIVDAVRTPGGKRNGKLRNWHAADLASEPLKGGSYALRGEVVRMARQVAYGEASVRDDAGDLVSRATGTFLLHRAEADTAERAPS